MHSSRHEVRDVHHAAATWQRVLAMDWKGIRKRADVDPAFRAVACGATVSPAWFQNSNTFPTNCIWCSSLGTWYHIAWECQSCPWVRPPEPDSGWARRFGWVNDSVTDKDVTGHLSRCQNAIWESRWRSAD